MNRDAASIGPTLRRLRTEQRLAMSAVAEQAGISVATLSRVETNKQSIEVGLLLTLTRILGVQAADVVGGRDEREDIEALSRRLAALPATTRAKVLKKATPRKTKDLAPALDDLLATVEMLREELLNVQRAVRKRRKR